LLQRKPKVNVFTTKANPIKARNNQAAIKKSRRFHKEWCKESAGKKGKRRPFVRSKAIKTKAGNRRKIFIDRYQEHLRQQNIGDVARRLKLLPCVRELLENIDREPSEAEEGYKYTGLTPAGLNFTVILKERGHELYLLTFYPDKK
jgi:hypothetical protein